LGMSVLAVPLACQKAASLEIPGYAFAQDRVLESFEREIQTLGNLFR